MKQPKPLWEVLANTGALLMILVELSAVGVFLFSDDWMMMVKAAGVYAILNLWERG